MPDEGFEISDEMAAQMRQAMSDALPEGAKRGAMNKLSAAELRQLEEEWRALEEMGEQDEVGNSLDASE